MGVADDLDHALRWSADENACPDEVWRFLVTLEERLQGLEDRAARVWEEDDEYLPIDRELSQANAHFFESLESLFGFLEELDPELLEQARLHSRLGQERLAAARRRLALCVPVSAQGLVA